ncbi:ZPR1 zinc-finger domain-containing protein [Dipodascopsis tothii]|uniref:ZPR1 zinc-finger domain-containing protein n=1 Tax=Dipodascopsis tothii TaxID=44089 RepID=UPI0034CDC0EA
MPLLPEDEAAPLFENVGAAVEQIDQQETGGDELPEIVQEIESLCMNCEDNGTTRLLLTKIPYFREVIIMSFECPHCHFRSTEIQSAGEIQQRGSVYRFRVENAEDLNRQIVKAESCDASFPSLELDIPHQRGQLTTVEGLLTEVAEDLRAGQALRRYNEPDAFAKIEEITEAIDEMVAGKRFPFDVRLDDPAGNSWIEYSPGEPHTKWSKTDYFRTAEQNAGLGLSNAAEEDEPVEEPAGELTNDEVHSFQATCPSCLRRCDTKMKLVDIPHFKEVVIMSTACDHCGYKSNEVKTGGAIPERGSRTTLLVEEPDDLARDILKSETCSLHVPELNLDLTAGTLGGRFTTIEGLLTEVRDELDSRVFSQTSDSMETDRRQRWTTFLGKLQDAIDGKVKFTLILEDPLAASYLQNIYAPDPDPNMTIEEFDRTEEQNEDLGLTDMNVE